METQKEMIKHHLLQGKKISQRAASAYFGIIRLAAVVWCLKDDGMQIRSEYRPNLNKRGNYKVYYI